MGAVLGQCGVLHRLHGTSARKDSKTAASESFELLKIASTYYYAYTKRYFDCLSYCLYKINYIFYLFIR